MASSNRRQGLVYGPVRSPGGRDRGRILGNLLGLLVVVITVGLLGFGIFLFLGRPNATPPPSGTDPPRTTVLGSPAAGASGYARIAQ